MYALQENKNLFKEKNVFSLLWMYNIKPTSSRDIVK